MAKAITLNRREQDFLTVVIEAARDLKPERFHAIIEAACNHQGVKRPELDFNETMQSYGLDPRRFTRFLSRCVSASRSRADTGFHNIPLTTRKLACQSAQAVQQFTNESLAGSDDARHDDFAELDLLIVGMAERHHAYLQGDDSALTLVLLLRILSNPKAVIERAYPTFIAAGIWPAQARVLCELQDYIHQSGPGWSINEYWAEIDKANKNV